MSIPVKNKPKISRILAIDYGQAKIGLALGDTETKIALAYKTLPNKGDFFTELSQVIVEEEVKEVILGLPGHRGYSKGNAQEKEIKKLGQKLEEKLQVTIKYQEEMFTTRMAQSRLKEAGKKNLKSKDDPEAARIILESYWEKTEKLS